MDYNARFYSPYLNRFISPDSIVPEPGNPQAFNRYSYAYGNPIRYNDPSGHCPICVVIGLIGLALVANASHPLPPEEAPSDTQGLVGLSMMIAPLVPGAVAAVEPYLYYYGDKLQRASQTPLGQAGGNAAEEVVDDCLDGCTPESAINSAAQGAVFGEASRNFSNVIGGGAGNHGTASTFGDLTGMSRADADALFRSFDPKVSTTKGGYTHYTFSDKSEVIIRPNGRVVRTPKPEYGPDGRRINRGQRLDRNGNPRPRDQDHSIDEEQLED